jgi:hypothetical protein
MVTALGQHPDTYRSWHHLASRPAAPIRAEPRGVLLRMSLLGAVRPFTCKDGCWGQQMITK